MLVSASRAIAADAYTFKQVSRASGDCDVTVNDSGIKIVSSSGSAIVAQSPKWDVFVFNDKVKKYCQTEFADWHGNFGLSQDFLSGSQFSNVKFVDSAKATVFSGLQALMLSQKADPRVPATGRLTAAFRYDARARNLAYIVCDRISSDSHPGKLICQFDHIPYKGAFPIGLKFMDEKGREQIGLSTSGMRKIKVTDAFFSVPKDYKKVSNQREIDLASKDDLLQEMLQGRMESSPRK